MRTLPDQSRRIADYSHDAVDGSDMHNGQFIRDNLTEPTAVVHSVLDTEYVKAVEERFMH